MAGGSGILSAPAVGLAAVLLLLAGCSDVHPYGGPGTVLSETPTAANAVLTCESLATERGAIAATLQQLASEPDTARESAVLSDRDRALTALAQSKRCSGS